MGLILWYSPGNGKGHEFRHLECEKTVYVRVTYVNGQGMRGIKQIQWVHKRLGGTDEAL